MTTMNPLNGVQTRPTYDMAPEFTNNNYLMGMHQGPGSMGSDPVTVQHSRDFVLSGNMNNSAQILTDRNAENVVHHNEVYGQCFNQNILSSENLRVTNITNSALTDGTSVELNSELNYQQVPNNLTIGNGNFTFTSPTQSTIYSPGITSLPLSNRFIQPHAFAPTSCLQWQHTVPQRIPWSSCGTTSCEQDILHFTGNGSTTLDVTFANQSIPVCSLPQRKSPIPSCSHPPRRLKRRAPDSQRYVPSKVHLTEDMISKHMQGLQIENGAVPSTGQGPTNQHWQKFLELENRLSVSDDEEGSSQEGNQPRLHIVEDIVNMVKLEPAIPQEIMHKISNPHMELVLWTPPGGAIKDFIESNSKSSQRSETASNITSIDNLDMMQSNTESHIQSLPSSIAVNVEEDGMMDIETEEDFML